MENYDVAVVRCKTYDVETVKPALEEALNAVNGLDFVKPGMKIIIKHEIIIQRDKTQRDKKKSPEKPKPQPSISNSISIITEK